MMFLGIEFGSRHEMIIWRKGDPSMPSARNQKSDLDRSLSVHISTIKPFEMQLLPPDVASYGHRPP